MPTRKPTGNPVSTLFLASHTARTARTRQSALDLAREIRTYTDGGEDELDWLAVAEAGELLARLMLEVEKGPAA